MKRLICLLLVLMVTLGTISSFPVAAYSDETYTVRVECKQIWDGTPPSDGRTLQYTLTPESESYPLPTGGLTGGPRGSYLFNLTLEETTLILEFPFTHAGFYYYTVQAYSAGSPRDYYTYSKNVYRLMIGVAANSETGELTVLREMSACYQLANEDKVTQDYEEDYELGKLYMVFGPSYDDSPKITKQTKDLELRYGYSDQKISLTMDNGSGWTSSYQWYRYDDKDTEPKAVEGATGTEITIPEGKEAGTTEYYYCVISSLYKDGSTVKEITSGTVKVTVKKAAAPDPGQLKETEGPQAVQDLREDGKDHVLVTAPQELPDGYDKVQYSIDGENWTDDPPAGNEAGEYLVRVRYIGDGNHEDFNGLPIHVFIQEASIVIWLDYEDEELERKAYVDGEEEPSYTGDEPTKPDDDKYTYEFLCWDEGSVEGKTTTYRPIFSKTIKPHTHDWVWVIDRQPTCGEEGKQHQKCSICDTVQAENTPVEKTPHVWKDDPSFAFSEDGSKVLATFTCANDPDHTATEEAEITGDPDVVLPTETEDGKYVYPVTVTLDGKDYEGTAEKTIARAEEGTYSYDGDAAEWTKGSGKDAELHFVRSENDDITFDSFRKLLVDGEELGDENFTAKAGSVVVTLNADYLETLTEGGHTVRAEFTDGSAETVLTVRKEEVPATGVGDHMAAYACIVILSMVSLAAAVSRRKRNNA